MMGESVMRLLELAREGDPAALDRVYETLYQELARIARAQLRRHRRGTLNTGTLIHESYLKLVDHAETDLAGRTHFLALSARAMRQVLVDHFRRRSAAKRGGAERALPLAEELVADRTRGDRLLALDEALSRLAEREERLAEVVEMKFFGGMTYDEIAARLEVAPRTVRRDWFKAKAWLALELGEEAGVPE